MRTFGELFKSCEKRQPIPYERLDRACTYIFELVSPYQRVVIPYKETKIFHLGTRCNNNGRELDTDIGIERPVEYSFNSLADVIEMAQKLPPDKEGYVVVDNHRRRVKVKSPAYIAAHYCGKEVVTEQKLMEIVRKGEGEEFLAYFSEYAADFEHLEKRYERLLGRLNDESGLMRSTNFKDRKEFALNFACNTAIPSLFFKLWDKKCTSLEEGLGKMSSEELLKVLE